MIRKELVKGDERDLYCMARMSFSNHMDRKEVMRGIYILYILGLIHPPTRLHGIVLS
jgi:hypothetical protein